MEQLLPFHDWQALLLCTSYGKGECKGRNQKNLGELLHVVSPSPTRVGERRVLSDAKHLFPNLPFELDDSRS